VDARPTPSRFHSSRRRTDRFRSDTDRSDSDRHHRVAGQLVARKLPPGAGAGAQVPETGTLSLVAGQTAKHPVPRSAPVAVDRARTVPVSAPEPAPGDGRPPEG